jgi:uncharacterized membrane protein (UPF0127 family)
MSYLKYLIIAPIVIILFFLFFKRKLPIRTILIKDQNFQIEIAKNPLELSTGLSKRKYLCPNCGMLFIFPFDQILSFWMKDTLIPLDMIFLDNTGKIINIVTAHPQQLTIYQSSTLAKYCLELNALTSKKLNLQPGDILNLNDQ